MGSRGRELRQVAFAWGAVAATAIAVQRWAAQRQNPQVSPYPWWSPGGAFAAMAQFDSFPYLEIATTGYSDPDRPVPTVAWFPGYPLAIRMIHALGIEVRLAAVLVTLVTGLLAFLLLWRWMETAQVPLAQRRWTLAAALLFPYSFFLYGPIYADALFVAVCIGSLSAMAARRPYLAAILGILATATKPQGLAVVLGLLVMSLEQGGALAPRADAQGWRRRFAVPTRLDRRRLRAVDAVPLLALAGQLGYMAYTTVRYDNPLLFLHAQRYWNHGPEAGPESWFKLHIAWALVHDRDWAYLAQVFGQGLLVGLAVLSVPFVGRRFGWGMGAYVGGLLAILLVSTADFIGTGRYLLAAFPCAALLGGWCAARPRVAQAVLATSGALMLWHMARYATYVYFA